MSKIYDYVVNNEVNKNVLKSIDESSEGSSSESGSGDWSIAEVTIASPQLEDVDGLLIPYIENDTILRTSNCPDVGIYQVPLYKGSAQIVYVGLYSRSCDGNITLDNMGVFTVTGNGTITVSTAKP